MKVIYRHLERHDFVKGETNCTYHKNKAGSDV